MSAASRMLACRVLGIPYPMPEVDRARVQAQADTLDRYDADPRHRPFAPRRWTTENHDPGDEDRS